MRAPEKSVPTTPDAILAEGDQFWPLRMFRELDDVLLRMRTNEPEIGTVVLKATGDPKLVLEADQVPRVREAFVQLVSQPPAGISGRAD